MVHISSVQALIRVQLSATPWAAAHQASLSITNSQSPPKPMSIESVMPSNHLILCRPLLLLLQSFPASGSFPIYLPWSDGTRCHDLNFHIGFPCGSSGKESACSVGDLGFILGLERSPREGKSYPLQYSGLENPTDCIVHEVSKRLTWLSDFHFTSFS